MFEKDQITKILGREWLLLLLSLLIAFVIWFLYILSRPYSSFYEYEVNVTTNIEGHAPTAVANEILIVRGKGSGFLILRNRIYRKVEKINLSIEPSLFKKVDAQEDKFVVLTSDLYQPLLKELGNDYEIEYIETPQLSFNFLSQTYKKVPIIAQADVKYLAQYMPTSDVKLSPDSIIVYGTTEDLKRVNFVNTKMISLYDVNKSIQGVVNLEPINGFRFSEEHTTYSIDVVRYVENSSVVNLEVINLPADKDLTLVPSQVEVYYRIPFNSGEFTSQEAPTFSVDYNDFISSRLGIVIPVLTKFNGKILSYRLEPNVVKCIQTQ